MKDAWDDLEVDSLDEILELQTQEACRECGTIKEPGERCDVCGLK